MIKLRSLPAVTLLAVAASLGSTIAIGGPLPQESGHDHLNLPTAVDGSTHPELIPDL